MFGLIDKLTSIAAFVIGALIGAFLSGVTVMFIYEGLSIPLPIIGSISLIDGRVDKVRNQEKAICQERIDASIKATQERDAQSYMSVIKQQNEDAQEDANTIAQQQADLVEYQKQLALTQMPPECGFNQSDLDRLRPH